MFKDAAKRLFSHRMRFGSQASVASRAGSLRESTRRFASQASRADSVRESTRSQTFKARDNLSEFDSFAVGSTLTGVGGCGPRMSSANSDDLVAL
ncbi:unnamed protein product [Durusdinium trenchii]|uniref:Uncharacterized protein n=1 Tax=Durusdinium trenchii TaxID=1381693 RepID=A0ABP0RB31_9DINO